MQQLYNMTPKISNLIRYLVLNNSHSLFHTQACKRCNFQKWYSKEVSQQIDELGGHDAALQPVDMGFPCMKLLGAMWIEQMVEYIRDNPQFIVGGFVWLGISLALDGISIEEDPEEDTTDDDYKEVDDEENDEEDTGNEEESGEETGDEEQISDH